MRHPIRATAPRLLTLLLAGILAAPVAAATPTGQSPTGLSALAPAPSFRESRRELRGGRRVLASEVASRGEKPRAHRDKPLLTWTPRSGRGPQPSGPLAAAAPPNLAATTARPPIAAPTIDGFAFGGPFTNLEPPDPWLAVGPDHIVHVVNVAMRITNRQGQTLQELSLAEFFELPTSPETRNTDPRVIYDSLHGRWILVELSFDCVPGGDASIGHGYLDFAISETADPTAGWTTYNYVYPDAIPDYPGVGTSTDKVVIASNLFPFVGPGCVFGGFAGIDFSVLDWGQLKTAPSPAAIVDAYFASEPNLFTFRPALQVPATDTIVRGIVAIENLGEADVGYLTIAGNPISNNVTVTTDDLTVAGLLEPFGTPPAPRQPGPATIANAVDFRPTDALWQNGRLVTVATTDCVPPVDSTTRACIRVSELVTEPVSRRQDFLLAHLGSDLYHGGIGLSMNGALHVTYTRSSLTENPSTYASYQLPSDATEAVSPAELLRAGTAAYSGARWGDYTGVAQDPQDPNGVWQTNEVSTGGWQTHISPLSTAVGTTFVPITPRRVLDTRPGPGQVGLAGRFAHGVARTWQVAGVGAIPANALAVTGNVTVVGQTGPGFVSVTPRPTNTPTSSTINFPFGDVRANNITIPLGPGGTLSGVYISSAADKRTHVLFDVTGYFVAGEDGADYNPLTPARVVNTRPASANRLRRDVPRSFQITGAGGVPGGGVAVTGNLTVTGQTGAGVVSLTPTSQVNPATSSLNFPLRDNRANGVTVPLSPTGAFFAVYKSTVVGARTHLIFDVTGYYLDEPDGLSYFPLNPGRRMDTRETVMTGLTGRFQANSSRTLDTAAHLGIPPDAAAVTGNLTVTKPTRAGYLALTPEPAIDPLTSTLNFPLGDTRANGITQTINGSGDMSIWFDAAAGDGRVHAILDVTGYFR
jgi:hypothetical protein